MPRQKRSPQVGAASSHHGEGRGRGAGHHRGLARASAKCSGRPAGMVWNAIRGSVFLRSTHGFAIELRIPFPTGHRVSRLEAVGLRLHLQRDRNSGWRSSPGTSHATSATLRYGARSSQIRFPLIQSPSPGLIRPLDVELATCFRIIFGPCPPSVPFRPIEKLCERIDLIVVAA